jgi:hypothetical protein
LWGFGFWYLENEAGDLLQGVDKKFFKLSSGSVILGAVSLRFFSEVNGVPYPLREHGGVCLVGRE